MWDVCIPTPEGRLRSGPFATVEEAIATRDLILAERGRTVDGVVSAPQDRRASSAAPLTPAPAMNDSTTPSRFVPRKLFSLFTALALSAPVARAQVVLWAGNYSDISYFDAGGNPHVFAQTPFDRPIDPVFDSSHNVYVALPFKNVVQQYSPTGANLGVFASAGLNVPSALVFDSAGNLLVANEVGRNIHKFSPTGADLGVFASTPSSRPEGLALDAAGNLYVASYDDNAVHRFSPTGADLGVFASTGILNPIDVTFDAFGNVYVVNSLGTIRKVSPTGADLGVFGPTLPTLQSIGFAPDGNLYVGLQNQIRILSPAGIDLGSFATTGVVYPEGIVFAPVFVPETSSLVLAGVGVCLLIGLASRRQRHALTTARPGAMPHLSEG
jgi:hypothetical protein